jgi:hypothetical protein
VTHSLSLRTNLNSTVFNSFGIGTSSSKLPSGLLTNGRVLDQLSKVPVTIISFIFPSAGLFAKKNRERESGGAHGIV